MDEKARLEREKRLGEDIPDRPQKPNQPPLKKAPINPTEHVADAAMKAGMVLQR